MAISHSSMDLHIDTAGTSADDDARRRNLYGMQILECGRNRTLRVLAAGGSRWVTDFLSNSPLGLNTRTEVSRASIDAIAQFGAVHSSVAMARAQTALTHEISRRLVEMKTGDSQARIYPTTLSANIATAAGFAADAVDATAVVHPNAHATVHFAVKGAFAANRIITTRNTVAVASALARTTRRAVVVIEDGLYSMGGFADFEGLSRFLDDNANGQLWLDDAHSVGMHGSNGRGKAMEALQQHAGRTVVTGSFGKAFGAAGGFMVGPRAFVGGLLKDSVADRFSCNLDASAQGAILAAMKILATPAEHRRLSTTLAARLALFDSLLGAAGITTQQAGTDIAFRVIPCRDAAAAIASADTLLSLHDAITTPVYYPTIARGQGAIRISLSAAHTVDQVRQLGTALTALLAPPSLRNRRNTQQAAP